jgi:phosphatidylserine synthase
VQENSKNGKVVFFEGTPIPSTVLIPTLVYFQFFSMEFSGLHLGSLVYLLSGFLQASKRIKIRKL